MYTVKTTSEAKVSKLKAKKDEMKLKDLLGMLPMLKKHGLEGEVQTTVRKLRNGRRQKKHVLELSRTFDGKELKVSAPLEGEGKISILRNLKQQIIDQIKATRKERRASIEDYTFSQGVTVKKLAEVYLEPNAFFEVFKKKIRVDMVRAKKPRTDDPYIGVEIEMMSKRDKDFICDKLFEAGMGKYVCIKDDGSISRETLHPHTHEINILVRQSEYADVVGKVCDVLNRQCDVKVNKSCGLHVHIDMRGRDVHKSFHNLVSVQQWLYAMLPKARRNSQYSYPVKDKAMKPGSPRYHGINAEAYKKYNTLELRMHCGTTQAKKINNWIALILSVCDAPKLSAAPVTVEAFQEACSIPTPVAEYVKSRIKKFESQHKGAKYEAEEPGTIPEISPVGEAPTDDCVVEDSEAA